MAPPATINARCADGAPGYWHQDPWRTQDPRGPLRPAATLNACRPYGGLETQAPDRASKGEGVFSAVAGTLQHPL
jgi:hypothetical protein